MMRRFSHGQNTAAWFKGIRRPAAHVVRWPGPDEATLRLTECSPTSPSRASWPELFRVLISGSLATPRAGWARAYVDSGHDGLDGGPCAPVALLAVSSNVAGRGSRALFGSRSIRNRWDPTRVCHSESVISACEGSACAALSPGK